MKCSKNPEFFVDGRDIEAYLMYECMEITLCFCGNLAMLVKLWLKNERQKSP